MKQLNEEALVHAIGGGEPVTDSNPFRIFDRSTEFTFDLWFRQLIDNLTRPKSGLPVMMAQ